jgi:hypothetical protein
MKKRIELTREREREMKKQCRIICLAILFAWFCCLSCEAADPNQGNRFVVSGDNIVLDTETGLMWAIKDNGVDTNWDAAKSYCENYSAGGHTDWRLPTLGELRTIYDQDSTKRFLTFDPITLSGSCPWSADTRRKERARTIFFMSGEINTFSKKSSNGFRALPVRKAQ